jgi:hypothetical protein
MPEVHEIHLTQSRARGAGSSPVRHGRIQRRVGAAEPRSPRHCTSGAAFGQQHAPDPRGLRPPGFEPYDARRGQRQPLPTWWQNTVRAPCSAVPAADAVRYMSVHSRKQPDLQEHDGTPSREMQLNRPGMSGDFLV